MAAPLIQVLTLWAAIPRANSGLADKANEKSKVVVQASLTVSISACLPE
jgi:hypothetical protein